MRPLVVPEVLRARVRQFAQDFALMASVWLAAGAHDQDEIDYMREVIRESMSSDAPPDPEADDRPRDVRINAWCDTFATLRAEHERENPPARNSVSVADMVLDSKKGMRA